MALFGFIGKNDKKESAGNVPLIDVLADLRRNNPSVYNRLKNVYTNCVINDPFNPDHKKFIAFAQELGYRCNESEMMQFAKFFMADMISGLK